MKNLFDYATKELSQDAFLCWLFANYDEAELSNIVDDVLNEFCELAADEKITDIEIWRQWRKIDIWIIIKTNLRQEINLLIEDKTSSCEHNQLEKYNRYADGYGNIYKIFFKTSTIDAEEKQRVEKAGWKIYDIENIYQIFERYSNSFNLILRQYVEHLKESYDAYKNLIKPQKSDNSVDWLAWQSYFNRVVLPKLKGKNIGYQCGVWKAGQYPYVCLVIKKAGYNKNIPYLEIRSRDCCNDNFKAKILCYGMDKSDIPQQQILIEKIKLHNEFVCKRLRQNKHGVVDYFPKQVGYSRDGLTASNDNEFIKLVEKHIEYYLQLMQDWK